MQRVTRLFSSCALRQRRSLVEELRYRELISQVSEESVADALEQQPMGAYLGADPSAASLHLGNLLPIMVLVHLYIRGHPVFPLVGGATGVVGDPSGRKTEREAMAQQTRDNNINSIHSQMVGLLSNAGKLAAKHGLASEAEFGKIQPVNNYDWWKDVSMLGFLGKYGRHIRVSAMLGRESVRQRLSSEQGIGFNEFTYQVLQAYDFWHLYSQHDCRIQIGGGDQWGNITAGIDLINRLAPINNLKAKAFGLTVPLLTTPSGEKFGKSAGNALFLDRQMTRPYRLYQYLINTPDSVVGKYIRTFTLLPSETIETIIEQHSSQPDKRYAQQILAKEVTELVHSPEAARGSELLSRFMFGATDSSVLSVAELVAAFDESGLLIRKSSESIIGSKWAALVAELGGKSMSESRRLLKQGSVYFGVKRQAVEPTEQLIGAKHLCDNLLLVRLGKTDYHAVLVE